MEFWYFIFLAIVIFFIIRAYCIKWNSNFNSAAADGTADGTADSNGIHVHVQQQAQVAFPVPEGTLNAVQSHDEEREERRFLILTSLIHKVWFHIV
jgi:hypothetical protein